MVVLVVIVGFEGATMRLGEGDFSRVALDVRLMVEWRNLVGFEDLFVLSNWMERMYLETGCFN